METHFGDSLKTSVPQMLWEAFKSQMKPQGEPVGGHFIQIGVGVGGFYIPEADFQLAQARANQLRKVQFVALAKDNSAIHGTREELHVDSRCAGYIAWIFPE